jgi:metal-responsive CopG/Arc/MetJ family transcriptional regulator
MARQALDVAKITISLPQELLRYADRQATKLGRSRSQVISEALADQRAREVEELAREGYAFYAGESEEFAAASLPAVSEATMRRVATAAPPGRS